MSFASMSVGGSDCDSVSVPVPDAPNPASVSVPNAPSPMPASVVQEQLQLGVTMEIRDSVPPPRAPPSAYLTGPPPGPPPEEKSQIIYQQPKPSVPMTSTNVGGGNRNALRVPVLADGLRTWSYGLFDCLADLPTLLVSTFAPCYVYSQIHHRFSHLQTHGVPFQGQVESVNHDCVAHACLLTVNAGWGLQAISRHNVRARYGIRGDEFEDVISSGLCMPCELVQEHREIQLEESSFYGSGPQ